MRHARAAALAVAVAGTAGPRRPPHSPAQRARKIKRYFRGLAGQVSRSRGRAFCVYNRRLPFIIIGSFFAVESYRPMTTQPDFLVLDILDGAQADELETEKVPDQRAHRMTARRRFERIGQQEALRDVIGEAPAIGESIHVVSAAKFDFWTWIPVMVEWLGTTDALYCSTWTLNRTNAVELFQLFDASKIRPGKIHFLTGLYFKRKETAVYAMLLDGIRRRGGTYRAFRNHCKVVLLSNAAKGHYLTIEGSANLTGNPRLEQYVITNDRGLHDFHRAWFDEMLVTVPPEVDTIGKAKLTTDRKGFSQRGPGLAY